jgi:hypothetical protein
LIFLFFVVSFVSLFITSKNKHSLNQFLISLIRCFFNGYLYANDGGLLFKKVHQHFYDYNYGAAWLKTEVNMYGQKIEVYDYTYYLDQYLSSYSQDEYDLWFMLCKIVPIIIFLVCLPFMKNLFVNQLALPRRA